MLGGLIMYLLKKRNTEMKILKCIDHYLLCTDNSLTEAFPFDKYRLNSRRSSVTIWMKGHFIGALTRDKVNAFCVAWREMKCNEK